MSSSFCGNFAEADRSDNRSAQVGERDSKSESQVASNLDIVAAGDHDNLFGQVTPTLSARADSYKAGKQTSARRLKNG